MKKLALILILSGTAKCFSQNHNAIVPPEPIEQSKFSLGLTGGYGHSFMMPYRNCAFNSSWNAGLSAVYAPWEHWGLGLDALFSAEGATFTNGDLKYTSTLNYLRVPVKAIFYFNKYENDFRPKISLGPTMGFLLNEKNSSGANSFDLGANLSAGFNYRLVRAVWLNLDAAYYQGLMDVYNSKPDNVMNGNVRLNLGLSIGF